MVQNKTAWKHGAARAVKAIFAVLGALTIVFFAFFGGEFSTLKTLNRVEDDANLFTMEYKADYALDRFLKIGASTVHRIQQRKPSDFSGEGNYDSGRAVCAAGRRERKGLSGRRFTD